MQCTQAKTFSVYPQHEELYIQLEICGEIPAMVLIGGAPPLRQPSFPFNQCVDSQPLPLNEDGSNP